MWDQCRWLRIKFSFEYANEDDFNDSGKESDIRKGGIPSSFGATCNDPFFFCAGRACWLATLR